jgi:hypothetical protein
MSFSFDPHNPAKKVCSHQKEHERNPSPGTGESPENMPIDTKIWTLLSEKLLFTLLPCLGRPTHPKLLIGFLELLP